MKKTIELIDEQHAALVDVIQFLDANGHSNDPIRETVDKVLNGSRWERLEEESDKEIKQARELANHLAQMCMHADEDCPAEHRTKHFRSTMNDAYDFLKKIGYLK